MGYETEDLLKPLLCTDLRRYTALTVINDNSTRLAYRKLCQRVIFYKSSCLFIIFVKN